MPGRRGDLLQLDLNVDTSGQIQLHQRVNGFVRRVDDVHQTLVRTDFQLIATCLVDVRRTQNVEALHAGWQRHGALDNCAGALGPQSIISSGLPFDSKTAAAEPSVTELPLPVPRKCMLSALIAVARLISTASLDARPLAPAKALHRNLRARQIQV